MAAYTIGNMVGASRVIALRFCPYAESGLFLRQRHKMAITVLLVSLAVHTILLNVHTQEE